MTKSVEHNPIKECTAIVLAAGVGKRMNSSTHKQFVSVLNKPVLYYSLQAFQECSFIDNIVIVTGENDIEYCKREIVDRFNLSKVNLIVPGGSQRYESVALGLKAIDPCGYVFIHDGVRPMIDAGILERTYYAAQVYKACVAAMPVKDTIKISDTKDFVKETPPREFLWSIQTPQVFSYQLIYEAYRKLMLEGRTDCTDDAMVVEEMVGWKVKLIIGSYENIKITTPEDLKLAEMFLEKEKEVSTIYSSGRNWHHEIQ